MLRQDVFKTMGMNQDASFSQPIEGMAYENMNLRITTTDNNTLLQWTNERGTKKITKYVNAFINSSNSYNNITELLGFFPDETLIFLGYASIDKYLVLFAQSEERDKKYDYILRVEFKEENGDTVAYLGCLYCGDLNFDPYHPIETITFYENEEIQKVYWVDGINSFRCIEIVHNNTQYSASENFSSSGDIIDIDNVDITRDTSTAAGSFPSGTVQYVLTGVNYYGAESNISYITPLHYVSDADYKGGSPEGVNSVLFRIKINISNPNNWRYIKIYSIIRTSLNGTPIIKHLKDIKITDKTEYNIIDANITGDIIAPTDLFFVGSKTIIPNTITQKDNTLFLGNYTLINNLLDDVDGINKDSFRNLKIEWSLVEPESVKSLHEPSGEFPYTSSIISDSYEATHFKNGEWYRFGIVLQYNTGETSEVIYIGDSKCEIPIQSNVESDTYKVPIPKITLNPIFVKYLTENNIKNIFPVIVYTNDNDCSVLAQGVCNPTVYNVKDRLENAPFSQPSWFYRPYPPGEVLRKSNEQYDKDYELKYQIKLNKDITHLYKRYFEDLFEKDILDRIKYPYIVKYKNGKVLNFNDDYEAASLGGIIDNDGFIDVSNNSLTEYGSMLPVPEDLLYYGKYNNNSIYPLGITYPVPQLYYTNIEKTDSYIISKYVKEYYGKIVYNIDLPKYGSWIEFRHDMPIPSSLERNGEIQSNFIKDYWFTENYDTLVNINSYTACTPYYKTVKNYDVKNHNNPTDNLIYSSKEEYAKILGDKFFIDYNNFTFHSPELEYNESFLTRDYSKVKFRITGIVPITSNVADYDIVTDEGPMPYAGQSEFPRGLVKEDLKINKLKFNTIDELGTANLGYKTLCSAPIWEDDIEDREPVEGYQNKKPSIRYVIYPWHSEYLNNGTSTGTIKYKTLYNNRYSYNNIYFKHQTVVNTEDIIIPNIVNKLDKFENGNVYYCTDIDKIVIPSLDNNPLLERCKYYEASNLSDIDVHEPKYKILGYPIILSDLSLDKNENGKTNVINGVLAYNSDSYSGIYKTLFNTIAYDIYNVGIFYKDLDGTNESSIYAFPVSNAHNVYSFINNSQFGLSGLFYNMTEEGVLTYKNNLKPNPKVWSTQPCRIRYKSTQHGVVSLGSIVSNNKKYLKVLPKLYGNNSIGKDIGEAFAFFNLPENCYYFWDKDKEYSGSYQDYLVTSISDDEEGVLDEYKDFKYGYLILAELYRDIDKNIIFGGDTESDIETNSWIIAGKKIKVDSNNIVVKWTQGDFYYQRYNNILTKPYSTQDKNSIFDSLSFMVETRINIDGVYSKNRIPVTSIVNYEHLNELNTAYSQLNNYFNYYAIDENKFNSETFKNTVTWTRPKVAGSITDNWLNITAVNTLDLNGSYNELTSLKTFNRTLLAFQKNAISVINYNDRVQIQASDKVPIEIANNGKVDGYQILSSNVGCQNKWSICESSKGLYFIDNISKDIYVYDSQNGLQELGSTKYMRSFVLNNSVLEPWNPVNMNNFISFYDKDQKDIYFINKDYALAFNESLGMFSSFYSYEGSSYIKAINDNNIIINGIDIYKIREGEYNKFFDSYKPFYTEVIAGGSNGEDSAKRSSDKIFNNIEFRSDSFDSSGIYIPDYTFDTLKVNNEYQTTDSQLADIIDRPSNLKKKFRIWRAEIPRAKKNGMYTRDRIRNPWIKLKLSKERNLKNRKTTLHDLTISYYD